jgi:prevent-host-death family protein
MQMRKIQISEFKATCHSVLERVRKTGEPVLITRFGKPFVEIVAPSSPVPTTSWMGALRDNASIEGDLINPATDTTDWEIHQK